MGLLINPWVLVSLLVVLSGCTEIHQMSGGIIKQYHDEVASSQSPCPMTKDPLEQARLRSRAEYVAAAAVAAPGTLVCRKLPVGSVVIDWLRGGVLTEHEGQVSVKIINPGQFSHVIHGQTIVQGSVVQETVMDWTPCVE
jgi:hypothetical protein